jgi:hypothetical protein
MNDITIPAILTAVAVFSALAAYRGVRRGGARFYTLEREAMLRRASFTLLGSVLLFLAAIALLISNLRQTAPQPIIEGERPAGETNISVPEAPDAELESFPPTPTASATPDPDEPEPTATAAICRAVVDGTAGSGLTLRDAPSGSELAILPDGTILTLLEDAPVEANNFIWLKVRTVSRQEGWVVDEFLRIGDCR